MSLRQRQEVQILSRQKIKIFAIALIFCALFASCGADTAVISERVTEGDNAADVTPVVFETLQDAYDAILYGSTAEFIGHHPIDESFLSWVAEQYGDDVIKVLAGGGLSDPEDWYRLTGNSIHVLWSLYCDYTGLQSYAKSSTFFPELREDGSFIMEISGDLILADDVATTDYMLRQENRILDCFSEELLMEMQNADILVINNEFSYTDRGEPLEGKAFTFRADPSRVTELKKIGTDVVNLANNHVFDYGEVGMIDTLDTVANAGLPYVGAGHDINEAENILYFIANGRKIALVSATQIERSYNYTREATETSAGVLKTLNPERYCEVIKRADKNADLVVAIVHWGTEGNSYYGADQISLAHAFAEAGADAIVGGHTHCLQGIEFIDDVPVYYSLGNYWFSSTKNMPSTYDGGLAKLLITPDNKITPMFVPSRFSGGVTSEITSETARAEVFSYIESISQTVTINAGGIIEQR